MGANNARDRWASVVKGYLQNYDYFIRIIQITGLLLGWRLPSCPNSNQFLALWVYIICESQLDFGSPEMYIVPSHIRNQPGQLRDSDWRKEKVSWGKQDLASIYKKKYFPKVFQSEIVFLPYHQSVQWLPQKNLFPTAPAFDGSGIWILSVK